MAPILYYDDCSPPVRASMMLIKMLEVSVEYKFVDIMNGQQNKPEFLSINPMHTVPTLVDDELVLTDSHAILIHLCEKYRHLRIDVAESVFPMLHNERMKILNMLFFESSSLFRRDSDYFSELIKEGTQLRSSALKYHEDRFTEVYSMMERILQCQKFMATDNLTIADISIVATLSTMNLAFNVTVDKWPRLYNWFSRMRTQPFYSVNSIGLDKLLGCVEKMCKFEFPRSYLN